MAGAAADHSAEGGLAATLMPADAGAVEAREPPGAKADLEGAGFIDRNLDLAYLGPIPGHDSVDRGFGGHHPRRWI